MAPRGRVTVYRTPALPQNSVRAIFQDHRSYLWFGTEEGVVRFDGTEFKPYRMADGLAYSFVQTIAEDPGGCIWVGTRIGLSRFDPVRLRSDAWRSFFIADGLPHDDVRAICADRRGMLWLATRGGLARLDPRSMRIDTIGELDDVRAVHADGQGRIWCGSRDGVAALDPETEYWRDYNLPSRDVTSLAMDGAGTLCIGTHDAGVIRLEPDSGSVRVINTGAGLPENRVLKILCDSEDRLWVGTESCGVVCVGAFTLSVEDGLADYMTLAMHEDRNGLYWFGSLAGLTRFEPEGAYRAKTWTSFTRDDGLIHNLVVAVEQDSRDTYWFGTYGRGATSMIERGDDRIWESFDTSDGLGSGIVRAIAEDARGRIWFGTMRGGISRLDPATHEWKTFTTAQGLPSDNIRNLHVDRDGRFWAGTDGGGIAVFDPLDDPPRFAVFGVADGLPSPRVSAIIRDRAGRIVAGTYEGGVAILEKGTWSVLSKEKGLPANDIYCLAEDPVGRLWIGTGGSGLACLDGGWRVFTEKDGLPNDTIYQILIESEQSVYGSTNRGVFRLRLEGDAVRIVAFDRTDGLADDECNGGASLRDRRGRFWFGTLGGASFIDPAAVPESIPPCDVFITGFDVHDEPMDLDRNDAIADSQYEFAFRYGAVEFVSPHKVRYRTRLEGFDRGWSKVTSERHIRYTNLRPGSYRFLVQARNWGGAWSRPAELSFEVVADRVRVAREEAIERERIEKKVLETAHARLQQLAEELREANEKLREKEMLLELQAREDPLTGVLNRRYLDLQLQQEIERAVRFRRPFSVVMADLDHFKSINDHFSHAVGDEVLRIAARVMRTSVRSIDTVARYGGEEFVFVLPETTSEAAVHVCEKIRATIAQYPWCEIHPELRVTASFGVCGEVCGSAAQMLHAADQKLFQAKREGRDRVCF